MPPSSVKLTPKPFFLIIFIRHKKYNKTKRGSIHKLSSDAQSCVCVDGMLIFLFIFTSYFLVSRLDDSSDLVLLSLSGLLPVGFDFDDAFCNLA